MRGDHLHNVILVRQLRQVGEECGATVTAEQPVPIEGNVSYADLLIEKGGQRIVCEAETTWRRCGVDNDVRKAVALGAQLLLIATPDTLTAQACRRQLRNHLPQNKKLKVIACPLGSASEILRQTLNAIPDRPAPTATGSGEET